ncbi:hypothetical protein P8C59_001194 [Phyllachora maydis]|uniref:Reverse transcriptase Ty1/copia-type domain-containing protein n=1 Tax=Phyllachora maydis TaxID=1825666 RepID=A0AAD9M7J3_9PEZI|nr:hypothetical protein P8C59_001194 [Phyllachora maydis]
MADQAKGKGIASKRASNLADLGQSSRPLLPIRTLLEDKEDGEDYSEVIEVLKQYIKSHKRVIASQSSDVKTLLLSLNTLKASIEDSVSTIKNISSTLASLTNSSNAAATRKTSYSPRFDPFSGTMDLDSPPRPPRKEPHLGLAVNSATSNLDPPIDTGSKEGFKDTITSSIVKELSKKAYTIPDDSKLSRESNFEQWIQALSIVLRALGISNFLENPDISNTYSDSNQAVLLILLRDSLSSSPRAAISWIHIPSKAFKLLARMLGLTASSLNIEYLMAYILEESRNPATKAYRAAHVANSSNSTPNSNSNPSKKGKNKKKGSYNLAIEEEEEESDSSSNSSSSSDSNTQLAQLLALKGYKKRKDFKGKGLKTSSNKAKYKDNQPRRRPRDPALYNSWLYDTGSTDHISNSKERFTTLTPNIGQLRPINTGNGPVSPAGIGSITLEVLSRKAPPTYTKLVLDNVLYLPNININIISGVRHYDSGGCLIKETLYEGDRRCIAVLDFKKSGFFLDVKGSSKPILYAKFAFPFGLSSYTTKSIEPQRNKIVVEIPSNSIRKEDYRPIIEDAIVSEAIEPNKRYKLRNSPAKGTTLEGIGPSLRGKRPCRPTREPEPLTGTRDLPYVLREPVMKGNKVVEKAISSPTLKEPNIGQRDYYNLLNLAKLWHVRLGYIGLRLLKKTSSITKGLPNFDKIKEADFHCSSYDRGRVVRRVSKALIPDLSRVLDSIEGDTVKIRPRPYNRNPIVLLLVNCKSRYRWVFNLPNKSGPIVANAIKGFFRGLRNGFGRYPTKFHFNRERYRAIGAKGEAIIPLEKRSKSLKFTFRTEECKLLALLGSKTYLVFILSRRAVLKTSTVKFIEDNTVLKGAFSPDPSNLNTEKPISIEIGPSKLEPYESSSDSELDEPLPDKPINPVIVESIRPTISIRKPKLLEVFPQTIEPIFAPKPIEVIAPNQPITNEPLNNSDLILKGDKMQFDYYKLLAKTSSYILSFVYKARKRVISKDNTPTTYKQVLKLPRDERSKWLEAITKEFIQLLELGVFKFLPRSLLPSNWVFYNAKTCHFIVTYVDDCLFIGPNIGYITDLKKRLNKVYAIEDLGPAAYFLGMQIIRDRPNRRLWLNQSQYVEEAVSRFNLADSKPISIPLQPGLWLSRSLNRPTKSHLNAAKNLFKYLNSTKDYSICFSCNGNTVADLGPKLSNSSNTTTKLRKDFHSKEGPRPLTTTSTTIVDSRNSKGDKATSKSTYGYLYKLAGRPISWKTKRATTIALSTLEAETDGLIEAIREV